MSSKSKRSSFVKYQIRRLTESSGNVIWIGFDYKIINKDELDFYKSRGWTVVRKVYPIWTKFSDYWNTFNRDQKIKIFLAVMGFAIALILKIIFD